MQRPKAAAAPSTRAEPYPLRHARPHKEVSKKVRLPERGGTPRRNLVPVSPLTARASLFTGAKVEAAALRPRCCPRSAGD